MTWAMGSHFLLLLIAGRKHPKSPPSVTTGVFLIFFFYLQYHLRAYNIHTIKHKDVCNSFKTVDHPSSEPLNLMSKGVDAHML